MKIEYEKKNFRSDTLQIIEMCNAILTDYSEQGYSLTVRQLYYQLVAGDLFPEDRKWIWTGTKWIKHPEGTINAQPNYDWLSKVVNDARMAGLIDWDSIVDRGRETQRDPHWATPRKALAAVYKWFSIDRWQFQPVHVEVMCEKQALEGVLQPACQKYDLPFTANKGYSSQSFMFAKGCELREIYDEGKKIHVIYFGDHDPSGLDMDRDIQGRLEMFMGDGVDGDPGDPFVVSFNRVALTFKQIEEYNPPPNPAKLTDSRAQGYIEKHGDESWELDALKPQQIVALLDSEINWIIDQCGRRDLWNDAVDIEARMKDELREVFEGSEDADWWEEIWSLHDKLQRGY